MEGTEATPLDDERAESLVESIEALEVSVEVTAGHLRSIAESLSSLRDTHTRLAEQFAVFVASQTRANP